MAEVSGADLMADPAFAAQVDREWEATKKEIKDRVRQFIPKFKRDIEDRYVEALSIYLKYEPFKKAGQWDNAFYVLHLYLNCVLGMLLHRPRSKYEKQAREVRETLEVVETEMDVCMRGIRMQIIEKHRLRYIKSTGASAAASPPPSAPPAPTATSPRGVVAAAGGLKRYSQEQIRSAMDALRLDGKRTNPSLYRLDLGKPTLSSATAPPAGPARPSGPPPSYGEATAGGMTGYLNTHQTRNSLNLANAGSFRVQRVSGDGNCAFRAMAQGRRGGRLSQQEELTAALELRKVVANELRRCADEEMTGTGLTVEQLVLMKDDKFPTFSEYIGAMSRSEYAGETEFWLLSRKLGFNISIYQPKGASYEHIITYGDSPGEPVMLLWQRGRTEAGNHYDLLVKA